jgi:hypothetical protein
VAGEEVGRHPSLGGLLGDGLGAVLAELGEFAAAVLLGPRAAGTVEAVPLVELGQRHRGPHRTHLLDAALQGHRHGGEPRGLVLGASDDEVAFVDRRVDVTVGMSPGRHAPQPRPLVMCPERSPADRERTGKPLVAGD